MWNLCSDVVMNDAIRDAGGIDISQIDPDHTCEDCGGELTIGEYRAAGVCTDCYFNNHDDWE